MLNSTLPLVYWDACVPLAYINGEPDRIPHIQGLLMESGKTIQLVTSVFTIAEVAWAKYEQDGKLLDKTVEERINQLWEVGSPLEMIEFYELIAEDAKQLMRAGIPHGWSLKPPDAIHLATADRLKVSLFQTYDDTKLEKFSQFTKTKFPVKQPIAGQAILIPEPPKIPVFDPPTGRKMRL